MGTCKNCYYWGVENPDWISQARSCNYSDRFYVQNMGETDFGTMLGYDGPVCTGPRFGCVNFEERKTTGE